VALRLAQLATNKLSLISNKSIYSIKILAALRLLSEPRLARILGFTGFLGLIFSCSSSGDDNNPPPLVAVISSSGGGGGSSSSGSSSSSSDNACVTWEWVVTTPATCEATGVETRICTSNQSITEGIREIAKLEWGEWRIITLATPTTLAKGERTCENGDIDRQDLAICGEEEYAPAEQFCQDGTNKVLELCGTATYTSTQFCQSGTNKVLGLCGTATYSSTQFCQSGTNAVKNFCGGDTYPSTQECCGSSKYTLATQFCQSGTNAIKDLCGTAPYVSTEYCSNGTVKNYDGFIIDSRDDKKYNITVIGTQTWMAENLNYNATNSKCFGDNTGRDSQGNCAQYGRLYNWATAMNISVSCNTATVANCGATVSSKHKGICPSGWHLPSYAEWTTLTDFVSGSGGTKLKSTSGWSYYKGHSGNGTDEFGFSALPGGYGYSDGHFINASNFGYWWSASEDCSDFAYHRFMDYINEYVYWGNYFDKSYLFSVRCLQD